MRNFFSEHYFSVILLNSIPRLLIDLIGLMLYKSIFNLQFHFSPISRHLILTMPVSIIPFLLPSRLGPPSSPLHVFHRTLPPRLSAAAAAAAPRAYAPPPGSELEDDVSAAQTPQKANDPQSGRPYAHGLDTQAETPSAVCLGLARGRPVPAGGPDARLGQ